MVSIVHYIQCPVNLLLGQMLLCIFYLDKKYAISFDKIEEVFLNAL